MSGEKLLQSLREHEHFAVVDLILRKNIRTGFRVHLNFRVGKAHLDRSDGRDFVGNGDKEYFLAHCTTGASARSHGANLPALCHGLV
jgi:hypothetical protein